MAKANTNGKMVPTLKARSSEVYAARVDSSTKTVKIIKYLEKNRSKHGMV